jgi:hypothetical protein
VAEAFRGRQEAPDTPSWWSRTWDFATTYIAPVLPSVITFSLGFYFVQSAELDLKRQELRADTADKIRTYVQYLIDGPGQSNGVDGEAGVQDRAHSTALVLGGFGRFAVHPLISVLESGATGQLVAAKEGLIHAGLIDPDYTCPVLSDVVADATGAYRWETVKTAAEVLGRIDCDDATPSLRSLERRTGGSLKAFNATVSDAVSDPGQLKTVGDQATLAIRRILQRRTR